MAAGRARSSLRFAHNHIGQSAFSIREMVKREHDEVGQKARPFDVG
jgi:hypothetical protein